MPLEGTGWSTAFSNLLIRVGEANLVGPMSANVDLVKMEFEILLIQPMFTPQDKALTLTRLLFINRENFQTRWLNGKHAQIHHAMMGWAQCENIANMIWAPISFPKRLNMVGFTVP